MKNAIPHLGFDGNCREAMEFYSKCMTLPLTVMTFADAPSDSGIPAEFKTDQRVMHSRLTRGDQVVLMAADAPPGRELKHGNNFNISLDCETAEEAERIFKTLGEQGSVMMPLGETFFAVRFGMLTDRYGVHWMINVTKPFQMPTDKTASAASAH